MRMVGLRRATLAVTAALGFAAAVLARSPAPPSAPEPPPRNTVRQIIEQMGKDDFSGMAASRELARMGEPAIAALVAALRNPVPRVRYWSIAALSNMDNDRVLPAILSRLDDDDALVRAVAVWHLGRWYGRPQVRQAVLRRLGDQSPFVRGWVLKLIQSKRDTEAAAQVRPLLEAAEPEVRYDALHTLAIVEGPDALDALRRAVRAEESELVRECALRCTTVLDPQTPRVAEVLLIGLRDEDEGVRQLAARLLRKGFGQFFAFDAAAEPQVREDAARKWQEWYEANGGKLQWNAEHRRFQVRQTPSHSGEAVR